MGPIGCSETLVWNSHSTLRKIVEERISFTKRRMMSVASQNRCPFNSNLVERIGKNKLEAGPQFMGDAPVWSRCTLLRNP
jgi:hypothetical protein